MLSLDTETTGLDLKHGARPFLVTTCDHRGNQVWWEWRVDPLTRRPKITGKSRSAIRSAILEASSLVLQSPKFDVGGLEFAEIISGDEWPWEKTYCTLLAGHLLASNQPHDLTSMALIYLGINVKPYEDRLEKAIKEAVKIVKDKYPDWRIAKKGLLEMPSAKGKVWRNDFWLPATVAREEGYPEKGYESCTVVNKRKSPFDIYIGRGSDWGNPFVIGKDGNRSEVLAKYRMWLQGQPDLMKRLPELSGKTLGCFCKPKACHGDILNELIPKQAHPWFSVCANYANSDSETTLALFLKQRKLLKERHLWKIYLERLKVLPIVYKMEARGVTLSGKRLEELRREYTTQSKKAAGICLRTAKGFKYELELPKGATNNSLKTFIFKKLKLVSHKSSKKTDKPSMDKEVMEEWEARLPEDSAAYSFIKALRGKRKRDTALAYMESYKRFWLPLSHHTFVKSKEGQRTNLSEWRVLHPSLNPTGTDTLRWSSQNPNEQNISKQEGFNLRYCFGPVPGREWWSLDAQNIELRIPAYEAGEAEQIAVFEKPDEPPFYGSNHLLVCSILHPVKFAQCVRDGVSFKDRYKTLYGYIKNGNFAVQYGAVERSGTADRAYHVKGAQAKVSGRFREVKQLNKRMIAFAQKHGYVETMPDKTVDPRRGYPLLCSRSKWGKVLPTVPLNYFVQGTAMWWMMKAMIRCQERLDKWNAQKGSKGYYMVMQVHDEIVFDFPFRKDKGNLLKVNQLRMLMEKGGGDIGLPTPVSIEYHPQNWSEGKAI